MDPDNPTVAFELKRSSWENIFRVLKWCAPMHCSNEEEYKAQTDEFWSLGNFWASVQSLQGQLSDHTRLTDLYQREWPPLPAEDAENFVLPCSLCGARFVEGDVLCAIEIEPADAGEIQRKKRGEAYTAACDVAHKACYEKAARVVRFVETDKL